MVEWIEHVDLVSHHVAIISLLILGGFFFEIGRMAVVAEFKARTSTLKTRGLVVGYSIDSFVEFRDVLRCQDPKGQTVYLEARKGFSDPYRPPNDQAWVYWTRDASAAYVPMKAVALVGPFFVLLGSVVVTIGVSLIEPSASFWWAAVFVPLIFLILFRSQIRFFLHERKSSSLQYRETYRTRILTSERELTWAPRGLVKKSFEQYDKTDRWLIPGLLIAMVFCVFLGGMFATKGRVAFAGGLWAIGVLLACSVASSLRHRFKRKSYLSK